MRTELPTQYAGRPTKGFTLVELLVVIGIIALLISILLPALNRARGQAYQVACAANLRQMGIAMTMYINEQRYYPGTINNRGGVAPYAVWPTRLRKVMKGAQKVFKCPAQDLEFDWAQGGTTGDVAIASDDGFGYTAGESLLNVTSFKFSYGYNDWGAGQDPTGSPNGVILADGSHLGATGSFPNSKQMGLGGDVDKRQGCELKASRVKKPAEVIAICDNTPDGKYDFNVDPRDPSEFPGKIHRGGANVLYCDGHVVLKMQQELVLKNLKTDPPYTAYLYGTNVWKKNAAQWNNNGSWELP